MMTSNASLFAGLFVGLSVAVPVGPMGLLCIQRTLASGMAAGVSTGLGGATANVLCAAVVLLGLEGAAPAMAGFGRVLSAAGGVFLLWSAARTLRRGRVLPQGEPEPAPPALAAFGSAVLFNVTNPMSLVVMLALISPLMGTSGVSAGDAALFLMGMFAAVASWWVCLSGSVALLRSRLRPSILVGINRVAGVVLTIYGALALARSAGL